MLDITQTTIGKEITAVSNSGSKAVFFRLECKIRANGVEYDCLSVDAYTNNRDYNGNHTDEVVIKVRLPAGIYHHKIIPYRSDLTVIITKKPVSTTGTNTDNNVDTIETFEYAGFLTDTSSRVLEANLATDASEEKTDRDMPTLVEIQLINRFVEKLRMIEVGGTYVNNTGLDHIRGLLDKHGMAAAQATNVVYKGTDAARLVSDVKRRQIVIRHSVKLIGEDSFVRIMEKRCGGIYPSGFSYYFQGQHWYLFPPYALDRYEQASKTLTLINVPANRMPFIENTYRTTDNQVIVLATGKTRNIDLSDARQLNLGNGVRFLDANKIMDGFSKVVDGKVYIEAAKNMYEFIIGERPNGLNNVRSSDVLITSSPHLEYSKLAARTGQIIMSEWQNSQPDLIYPGMPVKYMYLVNDVPFEIMGVVVATSTAATPTNTNINERKFGSSTVISIFINPKISAEIQSL